MTHTPLAEIHHYDEELPFVYRKKSYPTRPTGDLRTAVLAALEKIRSTKITHKLETETQDDFETKVAKDLVEG